MACFADINVSQGNVATYSTCGGIFNIHLIQFYQESTGKKFQKWVKVWQNYGHESVPNLFGPPCI